MLMPARASLRATRPSDPGRSGSVTARTSSTRARGPAGVVHQQADWALRAGAVQPGDVDPAGGQRLADAGQRPGTVGGGDDELGNDRHGDLLAVSAGTERTCPYATPAAASTQWTCVPGWG